MGRNQAKWSFVKELKDIARYEGVHWIKLAQETVRWGGSSERGNELYELHKGVNFSGRTVISF
jgi:hypothetical protein